MEKGAVVAPQCATPASSLSVRDDRRNGESPPHCVPAENLAQRGETLIGAEQRLGCRKVGGGNAFRPRGDA